MENIPWYQDPALAGIDKEKLEFLQNLVFDSQKLNSNEMLPYMLAMASKVQQAGITFTSEEMRIIVDVLKEHSSPEELKRLNMIMNMLPK